MGRRTVLVAGLFAGAVPVAGAQTMPAGEYSVTVTGAGAPRVTMQCMAAQSAQQALAPADGGAMACSKRDFTVSGSTVAMDFACEGVAVKGTGVFSEGSYRSEMTVTVEGRPPVTVMTEVKRVGDCRPGQTAMPGR